MTARRLVLVVAATALVASGLYVFVYVYRWEWHRAVIAGVIFLSAEVGLGLALVFERLRRIERRLDDAATTADMERVLRHIEDAAPPAGKPFRWLTREADRLSVFVPILLGAGVVLSGLAWIVERIARASAGPLLERSLADRLAPLAFPEGALTGAPTHVRSPPSRPQFRVAGAALVAVALTAVSVDGLADLTQDRPDPRPPAGAVSLVTLTVDSKAHYDDGGAVAVAEAVWNACTSQLRRAKVPRMVDLGHRRVQTTLSPALGPNAQERLRGCLSDATVDRLQVRVESIRTLEPGT